ncbi:phytoene/squalene synthase family protein [Planococcus glaciei]|nr:phytoene/squalene synthase family protein [Planococcus glaciei]QDY45835.1 phytoene/squalene synthase family protein [Planococcus glaciei]
MTAQMQVQDDFDYCESVIRRHSKSFYYAFSKLPEEKSPGGLRHLRLCRTADDSVDETSGNATQLRELERVNAELDRFARGEYIDHPLWRALRVVFNTYDMDLEPFYDQIKGQRMDLSFEAPQTLEDVETYSYYVAGSVGRMLLPIIASQSKVDCTDAAVNLGVAMQVTNILRDVGEDFREKGRIYLPTEELERVGYQKEQLAHSEINDGFIQVWELMAKRAEALYDEFIECISNFDADSQIPIVVSAQVYREILTSVRQNNYDCFKQRNFVTKQEMIRILTDSVK